VEQAADKLSAAAALTVVHRLAVAGAETADLPEADNRDNREVANSNKAVAAADTAGVCLEVHTIYNNRNSTPSTSPHCLVSKSIGNSHNATARRRPRSASV